MNMQTLIAWYLVVVLSLLLVLQHLAMGNAHDRAIEKLKAQYTGTSAPAAAAAPAPAGAEVAAPAPAEAEVASVASVAAPAAASKAAADPADHATPRGTASRKPQIPVALAFRSEPFEKSKIVLVTNMSKTRLACMMKVTRPSTGESQTIPLTLAPSAEVRMAGVGAERWVIRSGDRLEIAHSAYAPLSTAVP